MRKTLPYFIICLCSMFFLLCACSERHFIQEKKFREEVQQDFQTKFKALGGYPLLSDSLSLQEKEALEFLYAYMPYSDAMDYDLDYHLKNVRTSFQARTEMPWGKDVPELFFRHFVLPVRVNNENLDESRWIFYQELKERVRNLSMYDAILEINHWCHEKVIYKPSDARTSSPLASVKTAYGRCGEESTFTVAALRAMGIPARQVYTPRWAHTDDNHAWVEAWADGKWYFLGACEPEPALNIAWFNAPASRGMLMHTKVFGKYKGREEIMKQCPNYTEINVIENYAPETGILNVVVVDEQFQPVEEASVEFKLYNYAEYFTVSRKFTDKEGKTFLTAGLGSLLVWANAGEKYGFKLCQVGIEKADTVILNRNFTDSYSVDLKVVPPDEKVQLPEVSPEERALNTLKLSREDSIRNAYTSTFHTRSKALQFCQAHSLDKEAASLLVQSRGNYPVIEQFLLRNTDRQEEAVALLKNLSEKDLRDVSLEVLEDHLLNTLPRDSRLGKDLYYSKIQCPRVYNEMLTPYKAFFQEKLRPDLQSAYRQNPEKLVEWVKNTVTVDETMYIPGAYASPEGVWNFRMCDLRSKEIFLVAMMRSIGIPAWFNLVTGQVQYLNPGCQDLDQAITVNFNSREITQNTAMGKLWLFAASPCIVDNPKYYTHFTLSKITEGRMQLLNYPETTTLKDFSTAQPLAAGNYVLSTGTRLANGSVLSRLTFFQIQEGETKQVDFSLREDREELMVKGNFDAESLFYDLASKTKKSILSSTGRGFYIIGILGVNEEPSKHAVEDLATLKKELEDLGCPMIILFQNEKSWETYQKGDHPALPSQTVWGIDPDQSIQKEWVKELKLNHASQLPIFLIADTFNRVVFISQGYTIGLGEQLLKSMKQVRPKP